MAATQNTIAVTNKEYATSALPISGGNVDWTVATRNRAVIATTRMPMPESGLLEAPIRPAM